MRGWRHVEGGGRKHLLSRTHDSVLHGRRTERMSPGTARDLCIWRKGHFINQWTYTENGGKSKIFFAESGWPEG